MNLTVASSPHIRGNFRTNRIMLDVVLALLPALAVGAGFQGPRALLVALLSVSTCVVAEYLYALEAYFPVLETPAAIDPAVQEQLVDQRHDEK